ncbi:MAG: ArsR/SmtB family transcription factor [Planctomycetota bacterium]|jgi:DNA-binding transcriptional ArsR family regulator
MVNAARLARIFKALSVDARVRIVRLLKRRSCCVTELTAPLGTTQAATSQHLRVLRDAGIVKWQKRGFHVYYHLDKENLARLSKEVNQLLR